MAKSIISAFCRSYNIKLDTSDERVAEQRFINYCSLFPETLKDFSTYKTDVDSFGSIEAYSEAEHADCDKIIDHILTSDSYKAFNEDKDFGKKYTVNPEYKNIPSKSSIYKATNVGRKFISLDMRKANFSVLSNIIPDVIGTHDWATFVKRFTSRASILAGKRKREVIFGKLNHNRISTVEKYYMSKLIDLIAAECGKEIVSDIVFFSFDEIVFDVTDMEDCDTFVHKLKNIISTFDKTEHIPIRLEVFTLGIIREDTEYNDIVGYVKRFEGIATGLDIKGVPSIAMPFVVKTLLDKPYTESDYAFIYEHKPAKFTEYPKLYVSYETQKS